MYFYDKNGTTLAWRTANTQTTPLIWIHLCWTPSGNRIYSLQMRKEPISTRSPLITSCYGFSKTAAFCTALGKDNIWLYRYCNSLRMTSWMTCCCSMMCKILCMELINSTTLILSDGCWRLAAYCAINTTTTSVGIFWMSDIANKSDSYTISWPQNQQIESHTPIFPFHPLQFTKILSGCRRAKKCTEMPSVKSIC